MNHSILSTIASPRRREILRLVWDRELKAGEIAEAMPDVTFGAISLQLRVLKEAGFVESRVDAQARYYRARRQALEPVGPMLERMWDDALWRLKLEAELEQTRRGPRPRRGKKKEKGKHVRKSPGSHVVHSSASRNRFSLLYRLRTLGEVVGRRFGH